MDETTVKNVVHVVSLGEDMGQMVMTDSATFVVPDPSLGSTPDAWPSVVHVVAELGGVVDAGNTDMSDSPTSPKGVTVMIIGVTPGEEVKPWGQTVMTEG